MHSVLRWTFPSINYGPRNTTPGSSTSPSCHTGSAVTSTICRSSRLRSRSSSATSFCTTFHRRRQSFTISSRSFRRGISSLTKNRAEDRGFHFIPRSPKCIQRSIKKKNPVLRFLESFISEEHCDEREHGIIENHDISLDDWVHALSAFDDREITVSSLRGRFRARLGTRVGLRNLPNVLFGGNLRALCKKERKVFTPAAADALSLLTCPECRLRSASGLVGAEPSLVTDSNQLRCEACGTAFPIIDGVMLILPKKLQAKLYPEFCQ